MRRRPPLPEHQEIRRAFPLKLMVCEFHQDDPKKCTSARLRKFGIVKGLQKIKHIPSNAVVLNPTASQTLTNGDRVLVERMGLVALDCSWNHWQEVFERPIPGENRRLPTLLAGNPTNYGVRGRLSTAEALAATLFITGFEEEAKKVLAPFRWGGTFILLNKEPLEEYAKSPPGEISIHEREFFAQAG